MRTRLAALALLAALPAGAHPLGRDAWSLRAGLDLSEEGLRAVVVGEVPVPVVIGDLARAAADGRPSPEDVSRDTARRQRQIAEGLSLRVDGAPVEVTWTPSASALNGRAVDGFFIYAVEAAVPAARLDADVTVVLDDRAWTEHEVVYAAQVRARDGWRVTRSTAPADWTEDDAARRLEARFVRGD